MLKITVFLIPILFFASFQNCILRSEKDIALIKLNQQHKEGIKQSAKEFGLDVLENTKLSRNDIEIRFYRFGSSYVLLSQGDLLIKKSVLILKKTDNRWYAKVVRNISQSEKQITEQLNLIDSENLYQKLVNEKITSLFPNKTEEFFEDSTLYAIEIKINDKYDFTYCYVPNEVSEEKDSKQIAKLFNIVAQEFDFADFQAPTNLFE